MTDTDILTLTSRKNEEQYKTLNERDDVNI